MAIERKPELSKRVPGCRSNVEDSDEVVARFADAKSVRAVVELEDEGDDRPWSIRCDHGSR